MAGVHERELADALTATVTDRAVDDQVSMAELARRTGTGQSTMLRQMRGDLKVTVDQWQAIAIALGWSDLEDLLATARRRL